MSVVGGSPNGQEPVWNPSVTVIMVSLAFLSLFCGSRLCAWPQAPISAHNLIQGCSGRHWHPDCKIVSSPPGKIKVKAP
jgi:hypothetical protein